MFKLVAILAIASMTPAAAFHVREIHTPIEAEEFDTVDGCMEFYPGPPEPGSRAATASVEIMPGEIIIEDAVDEVHEDPMDKPHNDIGIPIYPDELTSVLPRRDAPSYTFRDKSPRESEP